MSSDDELEAIKHKKLAELQKEAATKAMMSSITEPIVLTDSNFASEVAKYPVMLVDFWAPWCGPCKMVAPEVAKVAAEGSGKFIVAKLNTEDVPSVAARFRITAIPTMAVFKNGNEVARQQGAMPAPGIRKFLAPWID